MATRNDTDDGESFKMVWNFEIYCDGNVSGEITSSCDDDYCVSFKIGTFCNTITLFISVIGV